MAEPKQIEELSQSIKKTIEFQNKKLVSRSEWGTINFKKAELDLKRVFSLLNYLDVLPLEYLADQAINQIKQAINQVSPLFEQIDKFTIEQSNATNARDAIISQIHNAADNLYTVGSPWVPFLAYQKGDITQNIEKLNQSVLQGKKMVEDAKNDVERKSKEIEDIIIKAREASASAGAAVFTQDFQKESDDLLKKAKKWLYAAAALGTLTLITAILTWFWTQASLDAGQIWQKISSKLVALSILLTATLWCGKIYKSIMHQSAANKHRALSLQTFQAFAAAASDLQTKDAVLLEATRSIFNPGVTGYIDSGSSAGDSEAKVIEIVKSIVPKK